jgi:cell division protein FtsI/penicillin-binding protein 2
VARIAGVATMLLVLCAAMASAAPQSPSERMQRAVDAALSGKQGAAIVLDVQSGKLLAGANLDSAARRLVRPGSAIKPFTASALLEDGSVKAGTSLMCARTVRLNGRNLDCSHVASAEPLDVSAALAYSCNSFFTRMAQRLKPEALVRAFEQAGLASRTGFAEDEAVGVLRRPASPEALQLMALGEDGIEVTPLGMAAAYRKLALRVRAGESAVRPIADGMADAVRYGTAQLAKPSGTPSAVAGKTGTATAEGNGSHAWFVGFAPAVRPEIVVLVFLERGSGGGDAAPAAARIFEAYR